MERSVQGSGFRGSGFKVQSSEFRDLGLRLRLRPHMQNSALTPARKAASQIEKDATIDP
jgi:hypothetical protein